MIKASVMLRSKAVADPASVRLALVAIVRNEIGRKAMMILISNAWWFWNYDNNDSRRNSNERRDRQQQLTLVIITGNNQPSDYCFRVEWRLYASSRGVLRFTSYEFDVQTDRPSKKDNRSFTSQY